MNANHIKLLKDIREHFDGIADGADDASYPARQALNFIEPLDRLISHLKPDDGGAAYHIEHAAGDIFEDVPRATVNALISIAISLREIAVKS